MDYNAPLSPDQPGNQDGNQPVPIVEIVLLDEAATLRLGAVLGSRLKPGDCVLLQGDLGAGKTTFVRGLLRSVAVDPAIDVPSPTFTLVQMYTFSHHTFYHYDLYRLPDDNNEQDLTEIGFFDALNSGIALVEWPERLGDYAPHDALVIHFTLKDDESRIVSMYAHSAWRARLAQINTHV